MHPYFRSTYEQIKFPDDYESIIIDGFVYDRDIVASQLPQVIMNWPSFNQLEEVNKEDAKILLCKFEAQVNKILGNNNLDKVNLVLQTPFFVFIGRKRK